MRTSVLPGKIHSSSLANLRRWLLVVGLCSAASATLLAASGARTAAMQTWPPFVLVAGLLLVGFVAHREGVFEFVAARLARVPGGFTALYAASMVLVAIVTVLLNLDTSVVFLTPILIYIARNRGANEEMFLYGCVFMSNAASLLLPGSNLTNLIVLRSEHVSGTVFLVRELPPWLVAVTVTGIFVRLTFRAHGDNDHMSHNPSVAPGVVGWIGPVAALLLILFLRDPAVPVLVLGVLLVTIRLLKRKESLKEIARSVDFGSLAGIFGIAVALGAIAISWPAPRHLMSVANAWETAGVGAVAAVVLNNLPAAVLLGSGHPAHPRALLLGLNIGPNLAVTGSLSALLWFQAARSVGAKPSIRRYSAVGVFLVPITLAAALLIARST